jgi:hypothetical protein
MLLEEGLILGETKGIELFRCAIDLVSLYLAVFIFLSLSIKFYKSMVSGLLLIFEADSSLLFCRSVPELFLIFVC